MGMSLVSCFFLRHSVVVVLVVPFCRAIYVSLGILLLTVEGSQLTLCDVLYIPFESNSENMTVMQRVHGIIVAF